MRSANFFSVLFCSLFINSASAENAYGPRKLEKTGSLGPSARYSDEVKLAYKVSRLPFDGEKFFEVCADRLKFMKGVPQSTDKCGPAYFPYVAKKTDSDPLVRLIGTHRYAKVGPKYYDAYDNPFANGLNPLFMVFPSLKDVVLVRVDDFDQMANEERDRFGGAYLAIKDGKVIDQLTDGCIMTAEYACIDLDGTKRYQLLETGKFKKM